MSKELTMILMVGAPASGKSTWAENYAKKNEFLHVSTDKIRGEVGKNEGDQTVSPIAFAIARKRVMEALSVGKSVIVDATNINHQSRKGWIKMGGEHGAKITAIVFEVSRDELVRRDTERERHVGVNVIDQFLGKYKRPDETEIDKVIVNPR